MLRLPDELVRVLTPDIGGGFGVKAHVYTEEVTVAWLALKLGRPIIWLEDLEHLQAASHARDQRVSFRAAVDADGVVLGLDARIVQHRGIRDPSARTARSNDDRRARRRAVLIETTATTIAVATNRCPEGPYRGVGMPTAVLTHERLMDLIAVKLGLDPQRSGAATSFPPSVCPTPR